MKDKKLKEEINPFGKIHDYISLSRGNEEFPFEVSDGTHYHYLTGIHIENGGNFSKPFALILPEDMGKILLTHKQMKSLLLQFVKLTEHNK